MPLAKVVFTILVPSFWQIWSRNRVQSWTPTSTSNDVWKFYGNFVNPAFKSIWPDDDYHRVPHICPLFCNHSASWKRRGGLYVGSDILSREYAPSPGASPRCWHRNIILQTITEAGSTPIYLRFSCPPETWWSRSTDRGSTVCIYKKDFQLLQKVLKAHSTY